MKGFGFCLNGCIMNMRKTFCDDFFHFSIPILVRLILVYLNYDVPSFLLKSSLTTHI